MNEFGGPGSLLDRGCWIVVDCRACVLKFSGGTQEEHLRNLSLTMSTTMEQVVTQLQQELFNLRAQVASQVQIAEAVRAINNLATAQVRTLM